MNASMLLEHKMQQTNATTTTTKHVREDVSIPFSVFAVNSKVDSLYKLFKKRPKAAERVEKSAEAWGQQKHDSR